MPAGLPGKSSIRQEVDRKLSKERLKQNRRERHGAGDVRRGQSRSSVRVGIYTRSKRGAVDGWGTFASTRGIGMTGLTRGKDYWARIRAVGPNGAGAWSDPATILVA